MALVLLALSGALHAQEAQEGQIRLASETWKEYTEADGTGLAWDIFRLVFEPEGLEVQRLMAPYTRSIGLVQRGAADAWVGSYREEIESGVFYPTWNYDDDQISALGLASAPTPTLDDLDKYRLVWVRGYGYQDYLPKVGHFSEIQRRVGIPGMLELGHADFYIDALTEVTDVLRETRNPKQYRVTPLMRLPMFLGFADTPRGHKLAAIYDRRMEELVKSGELRPIFERWQQPYPFD